jgi:hypothetical protein
MYDSKENFAINLSEITILFSYNLSWNFFASGIKQGLQNLLTNMKF